MAAEPYMVIREVHPAIWSYQLHPGCQRIGRSPECAVYVNHPSVSRAHAEIELHGTALSIRDLGSRNGTFVNGQRVTASPLRVGDSVGLGPLILDVLETPKMTHGQPANLLEATDRDDDSGKGRLSADGLSDAEDHVHDLLLQGRSEKQVAQQRGVTRSTIDKQVQSVFRFFGVATRAELLALHISRRAVDKPQSKDGKF